MRPVLPAVKSTSLLHVLQVREKPPDGPALAEEIAQWIKQRYPHEAGIVYALTRKECETLAAHLRAQGVGCLHYHADMDPVDRERAHQQWSAGARQSILSLQVFFSFCFCRH